MAGDPMQQAADATTQKLMLQAWAVSESRQGSSKHNSASRSEAEWAEQEEAQEVQAEMARRAAMMRLRLASKAKSQREAQGVEILRLCEQKKEEREEKELKRRQDPRPWRTASDAPRCAAQPATASRVTAVAATRPGSGRSAAVTGRSSGEEVRRARQAAALEVARRADEIRAAESERRKQRSESKSRKLHAAAAMEAAMSRSDATPVLDAGRRPAMQRGVGRVGAEAAGPERQRASTDGGGRAAQLQLGSGTRAAAGGAAWSAGGWTEDCALESLLSEVSRAASTTASTSGSPRGGSATSMAPLGAQALPRGVGISLGRCELDARVDVAGPAAAVCPNPAGAALPVATDAPVGLAMRRRPLHTAPSGGWERWD